MNIEREKYNILNYGPSDTGIGNLLRMSLEMDDIKIKSANVFPGFNRQNVEESLVGKNAVQCLERLTAFDWDTGAPYNTSYAFALALEDVVGESAPMAAQLMRMSLSEISRIKGHLTSIQSIASLISFGPITNLLSETIAPFHKILLLADDTYKMRPFGFENSFSEAFIDHLKKTLDWFEKKLDQLSKKLLRNPIFKMRTVDIGLISKGECLSMGITGVALRASGGQWDLRHKAPYDAYHHISFQVSIGTVGDAYERTALRIEEMRQSIVIIRQCLDLLVEDAFPMSCLGKQIVQKNLDKQSSSAVMKYACSLHKGVFLPRKHLHKKIEGIRGETSVFAGVQEDQYTLDNVNIRTGAYFKFQAVEFLLRGYMYTDIGVILASFDINTKEADR